MHGTQYTFSFTIYCPPPENSCAIHYEPSYHGFEIGGGAEAGNAYIQAMVGTARPGYHGNQDGAGGRGKGGGEGQVGGVGVGGRVGGGGQTTGRE